MTLAISGFDVALSPVIPPEHGSASQSAPFHPSVKELPAGFRKSQETAPFTVDTIFEKDVTVPTRDGKKLYCDIFRPKGKDQIPAILVWSPYGKGGNGPYSPQPREPQRNSDMSVNPGPHGLHMIDGRFGVPVERLTGYEKFEGLDPADWVSKDYAVINFDLRGCWNSEGIIP
jgi:predicted acyl esterase